MNYLIKAYKVLTAIVGIIFIVAISALDSETWVPTIALIITGIWLTVYVALDNAYDIGDA